MQDVLPGLHVVDQHALTSQIELASPWPVRGWCVVNAPPFQESHEARIYKARSEKSASKQKAGKQQYKSSAVHSYWKEQVLPLLNDHSIVLVRDADKARSRHRRLLCTHTACNPKGRDPCARGA